MLTAHFLRDATPRPVMEQLPTRITGRASVGRNGFDHQWPGFHATARFDGPAVVVALSDIANRYRVTVDHATVTLIRPGTGLLHIRGLGHGSHHIRLEKLSESTETGHFGGFYLPAGGAALPPSHESTLIEFIGDSDTVGYGNTAPGRECTGEEQFLSTDTSMAYGPMTARALSADYRIIAASGIGLVRNLDGSDDGTMSDLYDEAIPGLPGRTRAPEQAPDVIVIGIGSNDFAEHDDLDDDDDARLKIKNDFTDGLLNFLRARRAEAPSARIVLLAFGEYGRDLVRAHRAARDAFVAEGDHADLLVLPELARTACHWHPSLNDHEVISSMLESLLQSPPQPSASPN